MQAFCMYISLLWPMYATCGAAIIANSLATTVEEVEAALPSLEGTGAGADVSPSPICIEVMRTEACPS